VVGGPWDGSRGAAAWGSATAGGRGAVSAADSLVGSDAYDQVGFFGVAALTDGNHVAAGPSWNGSGGAAAWGGGAAGVAGSASSSNSPVGGASGHNADDVGIRVTALTSDNRVVADSFRNGHTAAAAWGNGASGVAGVASSSNSLVGSRAVAGVGQAIIPLTNGDDGVASENWNGCQGAVAWGGGTAGVAGVVSAGNRLIGSSSYDRVSYGGVTALADGDHVVGSPSRRFADGAATWGGDTAGVTGMVSAADSLVGAAGGANGDRAGGGLAAGTLPEHPEHPESETSRPELPGVRPKSAAGGAAGRRKHLYRMLLPAAPPGADGSPADRERPCPSGYYSSGEATPTNEQSGLPTPPPARGGAAAAPPPAAASSGRPRGVAADARPPPASVGPPAARGGVAPAAGGGVPPAPNAPGRRPRFAGPTTAPLEDAGRTTTPFRRSRPVRGRPVRRGRRGLIPASGEPSEAPVEDGHGAAAMKIQAGRHVDLTKSGPGATGRRREGFNGPHVGRAARRGLGPGRRRSPSTLRPLIGRLRLRRVRERARRESLALQEVDARAINRFSDYPTGFIT
jgi:hypothetical protein